MDRTKPTQTKSIVHHQNDLENVTPTKPNKHLRQKSPDRLNGSILDHVTLHDDFRFSIRSTMPINALMLKIDKIRIGIYVYH